MGRKPVTSVTMSSSLRRGAWSGEEDVLLRQCIEKHGEGNWPTDPTWAGLNRCRKSCRLRWLNYLRPGIKRGEFEEDEVDLIKKLHKLLGNRWSLISGRIPGRTANDIKNYWNTHFKQKMQLPIDNFSPNTVKPIRPQPRSFVSNVTPPQHFIQEKNYDQQEHESSVWEKITGIPMKRLDEAGPSSWAAEMEELINMCEDDQEITLPPLVPTSSTAQGLTEKLGEHTESMLEENLFSVDDLVGDADIWGYLN